MILKLYEMRTTIQIPADWPNEAIMESFKQFIAGFTYSGGLTLEQKGPNHYFGSSGSQKKAAFMGAIANEYHGDFYFELNQNPKLLHIDWDQGKMMKVGKMGMKKRKIFWENLINAMQGVLSKPYSSFGNS